MRRTTRRDGPPAAVHCRLNRGDDVTMCGLTVAPIQRHFVGFAEAHRVTCRRCRAALVRQGLVEKPA